MIFLVLAFTEDSILSMVFSFVVGKTFSNTLSHSCFASFRGISDQNTSILGSS
jgi:hypothetical protein